MIYFVRHGQTDDNVNHIISGAGSDVSLNDVGISQAKSMAQKIKDLKLDMIFCSPMTRAKQTLNEILKFHKDVPVFFDERLLERFHGVLEGQADCVMSILDQNKDVAYPGEETFDDMFERVKNFYDEILDKYADKNILVVAHNGVGRLSLCYFFGFPKSGNLEEYDIENATVLELRK